MTRILPHDHDHGFATRSVHAGQVIEPLAGSITIDGVALTVTALSGESFEVSELSLGSEWALVPPEIGAIARRLRETELGGKAQQCKHGRGTDLQDAPSDDVLPISRC